jgi:Lipid A 3-O-deacylase (PagL)
LASNRVCETTFTRWRSEDRFASDVGWNWLFCLAAFWLLAPQLAHSQETENPALVDAPQAVSPILKTNTPLATNAVVIPKTIPEKQPVRSEIAVMGMVPYGDYRLYSATVRCNAWTVGVEYDRHSWGHFMGSQMDYVVEIIPVLILSEPAASDFWGNARSPYQQLVPGISISPFGFRWLWRSDRAIKPYVVGKLGAAVFTQKALSNAASYANFNVQAAFGLQIRMTDRMDLRVEPFQFFHVSNAYLAASNPGMDELATRIGISYYVRKPVR